MSRSVSLVVLLLCATAASAFDLNDSGLEPHHWVRDTTQLVTNDYSGLSTAQNYARNQDPKFGRDAAQGKGALLKIGGGAAGFDFTRLCGNGDEEGTGTCPLGLTADDIGRGSTQWACTRDNITGRTWELKTDDGGLQDVDWTYSWYSSDASSNGGNPGVQAPTSPVAQCGGHLANCNTEAYAAAVNALDGGEGLCGYTDWRLPFPDEMVSIIYHGAQRPSDPDAPGPYVDLDYFPHVAAVRNLNHFYWTGATVAAEPAKAWRMPLHRHLAPAFPKDWADTVMLVRGPYPDPSLTPSGASPPDQATACNNENPAIPAFTPTSDFTLNADGTATHHKTGLIWDREISMVQQWPVVLNGLDAQNNPIMRKGHSDWRIPTISELLSIVELRCWDPAFNTTVFPGIDSGTTPGALPQLWTTTLYTTPTGGIPARTAFMSVGLESFLSDPTSVYYALLVRGGRPLDGFDDQFPTWLLRIGKAGSGSGTVVDTQGNCTGNEDQVSNGDCLVALDSDVTLQATADPGSFFAGWSEAFGSVPTECNGTVADCVITTMAASGSITAVFTSLEPHIFSDGFEPAPQ